MSCVVLPTIVIKLNFVLCKRFGCGGKVFWRSKECGSKVRRGVEANSDKDCLLHYPLSKNASYFIRYEGNRTWNGSFFILCQDEGLSTIYRTIKTTTTYSYRSILQARHARRTVTLLYMHNFNYDNF